MVSPTAKTRHGYMPARAVGIFLKVRESGPYSCNRLISFFTKIQQAAAQQDWSHLLRGTGQDEIPEKSSGKRGLISMIVMRRPLHLAPAKQAYLFP
jgi:hypothetical protein